MIKQRNSALDFRQTLTVGGLVAKFDCIATLIFKKTPTGWVASRWHCSVIISDVPEALRAAATTDDAAIEEDARDQVEV